MPVPVGAALLVPAGALRSAGGSPTPGPGCRVETSVYCNAPIITNRMHTHVTKKLASECCVQLGELAYANLIHMMHSYVHLYAQVYI